MEGVEQTLSFIVEWFDPHPQICKKYVLKLHCHTNDVEMRDIQTKRTFLSKTKLPSSLDKSDFFVGASILLLSRDLKVIDYADVATRTQLENVNERTVCVVSPTLYDQLGNVVSLIENAGFTLVDLHSTSLAGDDSVTDAFATAELLRIDPEELLRPEPLVVMLFRGANSIAAVYNLVQSSQYTGCDLFCFSTLEEVEDVVNFFAMDHPSRQTTATLDECTCCVIKPHAVRSRLVGAILNDIVSRGFAVSAIETFRLERAAAAEFLEIYAGISQDYNNMCSEMCSGTLVALEIRLLESKLGDGTTMIDQQEEVVETFRVHAGPWDVEVAKELYPDTIRAHFGKDRTRNAIHCTDLPKDGVMECEYFFKILTNLQVTGEISFDCCAGRSAKP